MPTAAPLREPPPQSDWFASWFDSAHYQRLYAHRDEGEAVAFIDRLIQRLQPRTAPPYSTSGAGTDDTRGMWRHAAFA